MGRHFVLFATVVLCCAVSLSAGKPKRVRVYVFTATQGQSGWAAPDIGDRQNSVRDLKRFLPSRRIECVSKETANVWLEVVRREDHVGLTVRLSVPGTDYTTEWTADARTWRGMAADIAQHFDAWLDGNLDRLPVEP
jgi:hypothetical protein